ncbi:MAG: hypothetical protein PHD29_04490 [bacterium]|nr:hypothetical protein [bacterium]MDD5354318.1 hypothetical protein [bacterium]MDD5756521.1 hypothetical protein [bacterium]
MRIEQDYEELLRLFNKNKVKYCIVGAYAVAFYSKPRYTKDIDIVIKPEEENAQRVLKALEEFGFGSLHLKEKDFSQQGQIIQLGYEPVRIDLLTSIKGLDFALIWKRKKQGVYGKQKVYFIGLTDLKKSKKISNRTQDQLDLEILSKKENK